MKKIQSLLFVPALATLAASAPAQSFSATDLSGAALKLETQSVLQQLQGESGTGIGGWMDPTHMELGQAAALLTNDSGRRSFDLDASLTLYVFMAGGLQYGGVSGLLTPTDGRGLPLIVQGEWLRFSGPHGELSALIFEPTGGIPAVRVVGAISARVAYDDWVRTGSPDLSEPVDLSDQVQVLERADALGAGAAHPSSAAPSNAASISSAPSASLMSRDNVQEYGAQSAPVGGSGGSSGSISSAPTAALMNRDNVQEYGTKTAPVVASGGSSGSISSAPNAALMNRDNVQEYGWQLSPAGGGSANRGSSLRGQVERSDLVPENLRGDVVPHDDSTETIYNAGSGNEGSATVDQAPGTYTNVRDRAVALEEPVGTDFTIDPTRSGSLFLTYRILN